MQETSSYAVGWGTLALINAGIAQGKNRSGLNWFLITLLLGPIATFILVAFYETLGQSDQLIRCPKCGRQVSSETRICPRCEHRLIEALVVED